MTKISEGKTEMAEIFLVLAELFKPPTQEVWNEVKHGHLLQELERSAAEIYGIKAVSLASMLPDSFEHFCALYENVLTETGKKAALPVESLYKPWTRDESCTLPFARSKGYLKGDSALHIQFMLDEFQFDIPPEYRGMPDHLSILLELLAFFILHAKEDFTAEFLTDHFDWLADFKIKLAEVAGTSFYSLAARFLEEAIVSQRSAYT